MVNRANPTGSALAGEVAFYRRFPDKGRQTLARSHHIAIILEGELGYAQFGAQAKARKLLSESLVVFDYKRSSGQVAEL
jgi:hypothetical protein